MGGILLRLVEIEIPAQHDVIDKSLVSTYLLQRSFRQLAPFQHLFRLYLIVKSAFVSHQLLSVPNVALALGVGIVLSMLLFPSSCGFTRRSCYP